MSDNYQQDQGGWEQLAQEEEHWHANKSASMNELAKYNTEFEQLLTQFGSEFMIPSKESN